MAYPPLIGKYPYIYVDSVYLKRSWGGEVQNISILVAIGVSNDGCRGIKRRAKAIGTFPDGQSALMLVYARLRHVAGTQWGASTT